MMKPSLLYASEESHYQLPVNEQQLLQDLHIQPLLKAMSRQDSYVYNTVKKLFLHPMTDEEAILHRQQILIDFMNNPPIIHCLYDIVSDIDFQSAAYREQIKPNFSRNIPISERLRTATAFLHVLLAKLEQLRNLGTTSIPHCRSKGLTALFRQLEQTYTNAFLSDARTHLKNLQDYRLNIGARIGDGLKGTDFTLRKLEAPTSPFLNRIRSRKSSSIHFGHSLKGIEESALSNVLQIVQRFIDESLSFTDLLRFESSFYVGCMHLYEELSKRGCTVSFPLPIPSEGRYLSFTGLYDPSLAISIGVQPSTNDLQADGILLLVITGVNQGGKTTFLRSLGLAQLMMQCGMFIPASSFRANLCDQIFTHFTREEDETMGSGKLDEELARLDQMIDHLTSRSLLLMNESFSSTTEREGSAIAKDLLSVCYELRLRVCIVTHFYELASWAYEKLKCAVFLSPARAHNGPQTYKLSIQAPSPTSYGEDLYYRIINGGVNTESKP